MCVCVCVCVCLYIYIYILIFLSTNLSITGDSINLREKGNLSIYLSLWVPFATGERVIYLL